MSTPEHYDFAIPEEIGATQFGYCTFDGLMTVRDPLLFLYLVDALGTVSAKAKEHPPENFDKLYKAYKELPKAETELAYSHFQNEINKAKERFKNNQIKNLPRRRVFTGQDGTYQLEIESLGKRPELSQIRSIFADKYFQAHPLYRVILDKAFHQANGSPPTVDTTDWEKLSAYYKKAFGELSETGAAHFAAAIQPFREKLFLGFNLKKDTGLPPDSISAQLVRSLQYEKVLTFFVEPEALKDTPQIRKAFYTLRDGLQKKGEVSPPTPQEMLERFLDLPEQQAINLVGKMKDCFRELEEDASSSHMPGNRITRRRLVLCTAAVGAGTAAVAGSLEANKILLGDSVPKAVIKPARTNIEPAVAVVEEDPSPGMMQEVSLTCPEPELQCPTAPPQNNTGRSAVRDGAMLAAGAAIGIGAAEAFHRREALTRLLKGSEKSTERGH